MVITEPVGKDDRLPKDDRIRDWLLFMLTVSSGAVDAVSFLAMGRVFTAFMTGNIAFLGLRIAGNPDTPSIAAILAPMAGFAVGIYLATTIVTPATRPLVDAGEHETTLIS